MTASSNSFTNQNHSIPIAVEVYSTPFNWCFFVPNLFIIVMIFSITKGENNDKSNYSMDFISLYGNTITCDMCNGMEIMVEKLMREEPMTSVDFLILVVLSSLVIYLFRYIRSKK